MAQASDISLNDASAAELGDVLGLDAAQAKTIADARPFSDWPDLNRTGLPQDVVDRLKRSGVRLGDPPSAPIGEPGSGGSGGAPGGNLGRA